MFLKEIELYRLAIASTYCRIAAGSEGKEQSVDAANRERSTVRWELSDINLERWAIWQARFEDTCYRLQTLTREDDMQVQILLFPCTQCLKLVVIFSAAGQKNHDSDEKSETQEETRFSRNLFCVGI